MSRTRLFQTHLTRSSGQLAPTIYPPYRTSLEVNPPEWPASLYLVAGHFVGQVLKSKIVTKGDEAWEAVLAQEPSQMLAGQISKVSRMNASDCRAEVLTTRDGAKH